MHLIKFDIEVHETVSAPEVALGPHAGATAKPKWVFPWRINMLATPKPPITKKYQPPKVTFSKMLPALDAVTEFYSDNLSRPPIRTLVINKKLYKQKGDKYTKMIEKSWGSTYNYYAKKLRDRKRKAEQRKLKRLHKKQPKGKSLEKIEAARQEHLGNMARPKPVPSPPKIPRKWKPLEELLPGVDTLAAAKEYTIVPPRPLGVNPHALTYQITEQVLKLAQLPERLKKRNSEPMLPGAVKKSALTAICTPRMEKLAQPSFSMREAKKQDEDKYDPWVISANALKYKPSPRILEMAKPLERK